MQFFFRFFDIALALLGAWYTPIEKSFSSNENLLILSRFFFFFSLVRGLCVSPSQIKKKEQNVCLGKIDF
jgi:hypothetical protein